MCRKIFPTLLNGRNVVRVRYKMLIVAIEKKERRENCGKRRDKRVNWVENRQMACFLFKLKAAIN